MLNHESIQQSKIYTSAHASHGMTAAVLEGYGEASKLRLRSVPRPVHKHDQVLIRVLAAGVNPIDWKIRKGNLRLILPVTFPVILGYDVSGIIEEVGTTAAGLGWQRGDEVFCFLDQTSGGGYAEYVATNEQLLVAKPAQLSHEEAAAIPLAATTAWQALHDLGKLLPGDDVLINGASGGVGAFAVQVAKAGGAYVTGVCSKSNADLVRSLGANEVIDYEKQDFTSLSNRFNIIFDVVSNRSFPVCREALKPLGRYVATLPSFSTLFFQLMNKLMRQSCYLIWAKPSASALTEIANLVEQRKLTSIIHHVYPLKEIVKAHMESERGHSRGKIVLKIGES